MATLVTAQPSHLAIAPRAALFTGQPKTFAIKNVGKVFSGLTHVSRTQFLKSSAQISSTGTRRFRTAISCSANPETLQVVQSTIAKQLSVDVNTVAPETKFADLGADSLDTVEIMMALEEQFEVSIGEGGAENIATVQDAADLIEKVKAASA